jgi:hypothetical protein
MNYKTLTIQEDSQASFDYLRMLDPFIPSGERRRIKEDLLNYCSYGTLAMVKIREELLKLILLNDPDKANARRIWSWNWDHAMPISGSLKFSSAGGGLVSIFRHVMKY